MHLKQLKPFLSIKRLQSTSLPSFTVLTGVNGSGKTHLLRGIEEGSIAVDLVQNRDTDIRYLDWAALVPDNAGYVAFQDIHASRDNIINRASDLKNGYRNRLGEITAQFEIDQSEFTDPWALVDLDEKELSAIAGPDKNVHMLRVKLNGLAKEITDRIRSDVSTDERLRYVVEDTLKVRDNILNVSEKFYNGRPLGWARRDMFQQSFSEMFLGYFDKQRTNRLRRLDEHEGRKPAEPSISESAFVQKHGSAPWDFVNRTLLEAKLDFEIDHPVDYEGIRYKPRLTKRSTGAPVEFSALSSGEKVLMSFAFCLYYSVDTRTEIRRPKAAFV